MAIVDDLVMILQYVCFVKRLSVERARRNGDDESEGMEKMNVSLTIFVILDKNNKNIRKWKLKVLPVFVFEKFDYSVISVGILVKHFGEATKVAKLQNQEV
eukprot:scaffold20351_cov43-Cyclotella_meneghiniana.AAC.1